MRKLRNNKIVLFGPGPLFKGGISNYNTSLAKILDQFPDLEIIILSWTQQYPAIIPRDFIDRSSRVSLLEQTRISVEYLTNYNNPFTWYKTYQRIKEIDPAMVIFQWAIALQGLPMGWIARRLFKNTSIEVVFDLHLVIQKEASSLDKFCTKYGLRYAHTYIAHAYKTVEELQALFPDKKLNINESGERSKDNIPTVIKLYHPVYDLFQPQNDFDIEKAKAEMGLQKHVFLFFGFIRKYKGLHHLIPAFAEVLKARKDVSLLIAGESFWQTLDQKKFSTRIKNFLFGAAKKLFLKNTDNEQNYNPLALVEELGLQSHIKVYNRFIPNEEVHTFFQVSDTIITFYLTATPSGVESLAYNFHIPVLATKVGHFPETIQDGYNGYLAEPEDIQSMAKVMLQSIEQPIDRTNVAKTSAHLSWRNYALAILNDRVE